MAIETRLTFADHQVQSAIERLRLALPLGGSMLPAMRSMGRIVKTDTQLRFRAQSAPDGTPWIPSQRVLEEGGQTLRLTGRLRNSITYVPDESRVQIGTNVVYGAIHQFGEGSRAQSVFEALKAGRRTRRRAITARPYLGVSDAGKAQLVDAVNDYLGGRWAG